MSMLTTHGTLSVQPHNGRIVVNVSNDFVRYYNWFITKKYWIKFAQPMYGAHVTVANKKFHSNVDWNAAKSFDGKRVVFQYDECVIRGGQTKGYDVFYVKVHSTELEDFKKQWGVVEKANYKGLHLTIANSKGALPKYWPEMIEIK